MKPNFLKSSFSKVHFSIMLFILAAFITGAAMNLFHYYKVIYTLHFYIGLSIFLAPAVVVLFLRNKLTVVKAFFRLATLKRSDFKKKNYINIATKITAGVFLIQLAVFGATGLTIKLLMPVYPHLGFFAYKVHIINFRIVFVTILLHVITGIVKRKTVHLKNPHLHKCGLSKYSE